MSKLEMQSQAPHSREGMDSVALYKKYQPEAGKNAGILPDQLTPFQIFSAEVQANYPKLREDQQGRLLKHLISEVECEQNEAIEVLFLSSLPMLVHEINIRSGDGVDPSDVLQEACMLLKPKLVRYTSAKGTFDGFVFGLLPNIIRYAKERIAGRRYWAPPDGSPQYPNTFSQIFEGHNGEIIKDVADHRAVMPEEYTIKNESETSIREAIRRLKEEHHQVLALSYGIQTPKNLEGHQYSYAEIASILGISLGAVKSRILRAKIELRDRISNSDFMDPETSSG